MSSFFGNMWPGYWPYNFIVFVFALFCYKKLILPAERRMFLKNKKQLNKGGQVIDL